jgi:hypothetical protein
MLHYFEQDCASIMNPIAHHFSYSITDFLAELISIDANCKLIKRKPDLVLALIQTCGKIMLTVIHLSRLQDVERVVYFQAASFSFCCLVLAQS